MNIIRYKTPELAAWTPLDRLSPLRELLDSACRFPMSQLCETRPTARVEYTSPAVNLRHDDDGYTLEVEMPGVTKSGVEITFDDGKLTVIGHRAEMPAPGTAVYTEAPGRGFRRVFDLDPSIDPEKINASIEQGLLTIRLQKAEASKPRKISVG
jgi:HSP20 family protein